MERENNDPHDTKNMKHLASERFAWILFKSQECSQTSFHLGRIKNHIYYLGQLRFIVPSPFPSLIQWHFLQTRVQF